MRFARDKSEDAVRPEFLSAIGAGLHLAFVAVGGIARRRRGSCIMAGGAFSAAAVSCCARCAAVCALAAARALRRRRVSARCLACAICAVAALGAGDRVATCCVAPETGGAGRTKRYSPATIAMAIAPPMSSMGRATRPAGAVVARSACEREAARNLFRVGRISPCSLLMPRRRIGDG